MRSEVQTETLCYFIDEAKKYFAGYVAENHTASSHPSEEAERIRLIVQKLQECCDKYRAFTFNPGEEILASCEKDMLDAAGIFKEIYGTFRYLIEPEGIVPCKVCGIDNYSASVKCGYCGSPLPPVRMRDSLISAENEPVMTRNIRELFEAADSLLNKSVSSEKLISIITSMEESTKKALKSHKSISSLPGVELSDQARSLIDEVESLFTQGTDNILKDLQQLKEFASAESASQHERGKNLVWQGSSELQKIQKTMALLSQTRHSDIPIIS